VPAPEPLAGRPTAIDEIRSSADDGGTRMISVFRARYLESGATPAGTGAWATPALRGLGLFQVPRTLARRGDYETLFAFARSEPFLRDQAEEFFRSKQGKPSAGPIQTLDAAFGFALELDRVPEMAALALSRARWGSKLAARTPLDALRAGDQRLACDLADSRPAEQHAFWYLLLAWELHDGGDRDEARSLLSRLLPMKLPLLNARAGRHVIVLLRHAAQISAEAFLDLQQRMLDENDRLDLCRELNASGQFALVPRVAASVRDRIPVLADAAKAAVAAGQPEIAAQAIAQAMETLAASENNGGDAGIIEQLARIAAAHAVLGDLDAAGHGFTRAAEAWSRAGRPAPALRTIAAELASAHLFDDARLAITRIDDTHYAGEALEALALAQARAGQASEAAATLGEIEPALYLDYPRAVRAVSRALAESGAISAATSLADILTEPAMRARALVSICRHPDGAEQAAASARRAIDELPDPALRAELLTGYAATRDGEERDRLFGESLRLAGTLTGEKRWQALLAIGASQLPTDPAGARDAFAVAREVIRDTEPDPMFWTDELWQMAMVQLRAGDAAGARQTLAETQGEPFTDPDTWLRPVTLAAIAVSQADAGQPDVAHRACRLARRHAKQARGEARIMTCHAIAAARAATGDLAGAAKTAVTVLDIAETAEWEDDEETVALAVEQGLHAAVHVAREMARAGREKKARQLLSEAATRTREWLENSAFTYIEVTGDLACALAELGKDSKAAKVAAWDQTGTAMGRLHAVIARKLAHDGDLRGALATAEKIGDPRVRAQAFCHITSALTSRGERTAARAVLASAAGQLRAAADALLAVPALIEIAAAQAEAGYREDIPDTLELARLAAIGSDRADDRDYTLGQVAKSWAVHGEPDRALELVKGIGRQDRAGEALVIAALGMVARDRAAWPAATALIGDVASPGWQAVGRAVAGAARTRGEDEDAGEYFGDVAPLLSRITEGEPRASAQRLIIEVAMAAGDYTAAIHVARTVTAGRAQVLSELASDLAARGAADAVKHLLPDCARQAESAYAVCVALARAVPGQADAIISEVAASRSPRT